MKCDKCKHQVYSDETSVGAGYVPLCNEGYWAGGLMPDVDPETVTCWDNCKDFEPIEDKEV